MFIYVNCWQHRSNLSASAAALFDTVLIARHMPQTVTCSDMVHDQLPASTSDDLLSPSSSSAFSDYWSSAESQNLDTSYCCRKPYNEDCLSELESVSSTEHSPFHDGSSEWPFVRVRDNNSPNLTNRQLPVTEDYVAELKPRVPVSHGLMLVDLGTNWDRLTARSSLLVKPSASEDSCRETDNVAAVSQCKLHEKRKEVTLCISKVKSSVCSVEETKTFQTVALAARRSDNIEANDTSSHLCAEDLGTSTSVCVDENGLNVANSHEAISYRHKVERDLSVMCSKDDGDTCGTSSEVCRQGVGHSATVQSEVISDFNYEICDIDNRVSVTLRDRGRSHSAEQLSEGKHSSHSVSRKAQQTDRKMTSASNQSNSTSVFLDESQRGKESIYRRPEICRKDLDGKYLNGYEMPAIRDDVAVLNVTSQETRNQDIADSKITENSLRSLCWSEQHLTPPDTRESDQERSLKDISVSSGSFSTQGKLALMVDAPYSCTRQCSYDRLFPNAPDSLSYLDLCGRDVSRHSYQNTSFKPVSSKTVITVRSLKSEKLELLPTVVRQTVVAHRSPPTSRICYICAASEPHRLSGILPEYTSGHAFGNNPAVKSESPESKCSHSKYGDEYASNVMNIHYAKRTLSDVDLAVKCATEGLSYYDLYCHGLSGMLIGKQTEIDRTDGTHTGEHSDKDAGAVQQPQDTCRLNDGVRSCAYHRVTTGASFHSCDLETVGNEDLPSVQPVPDGVSSSSLNVSKMPAAYSDSPIIEGDAVGTRKAFMEYIMASTDNCNYEQLAGNAVVPVALDSEEIAEISCKKLAQPGSVKTLGFSDMKTDAVDVERLTESDGDADSSRREDTAVTRLIDTADNKRVMHKIHDVTVEVQSDDNQSRTTSDTFVANNATRLETTSSIVEQRVTALSDVDTIPDVSESTVSMVKDTAYSSRRLKTSEMAVRKLNGGTQPVTTLSMCELTMSEVSDSEDPVKSLELSTVAVTKLSDDVRSGLSESTVTETKDDECSEETWDACEVAATLSNASHRLNDTFHSVSEPSSEPAMISLIDEAVVWTIKPAEDGTANVTAPSEEKLDTSETADATLNDAAVRGKTILTSDTRTTEWDDNEGARKTPTTADQAIRDDSDCTDKIVDSVFDTAADSSDCMLAAHDEVSVEMFSDTSIPTVATPDDIADSAAEISASVSAPESDTGMIDSHLVHAGVLADDSGDAESGITVCGLTCQAMETRDEVSAENFAEPDIVASNVSNCRDESVDVTADGDGWLISDSGIVRREEFEFVHSLSGSDGLLRIPVTTNKMLASAAGIRVSDSPADVSSQSSDLSRTLVCRPARDKYTDHCKADHEPMSTASDEVNSEQYMHVCDSFFACLLTNG